MVSNRKRKKEAARAGLNEPELRMVEILDEVLDKLRWTQVLLHAQSFMLREKLGIRDDELHRVLEAAARAVEKDAVWRRWEEGLGRLKGELLEARRGIRRERKRAARDRKAGRVDREDGASG